MKAQYLEINIQITAFTNHNVSNNHLFAQL